MQKSIEKELKARNMKRKEFLHETNFDEALSQISSFKRKMVIKQAEEILCEIMKEQCESKSAKKMDLPMASGEKRTFQMSNKKSNYELVASCLDRTPEPLQFTDRLRHTLPDDDSCFTPKRESLV